MSATTHDAAASRRPTSPGRRHLDSWLRILVILTSAVALGDVVVMALIPAVVPPLAIGIVLTAVGIGLLRLRPRAGIAVLGLTSVVLGLVAAVFLGPQLAHPGSPVDFLHAVVSIAGRALATLAAIGAWQGTTAAGSRRVAACALGLGAAALAVCAVAMLTVVDEAARPGDVAVVIAGSRFPATVTVGQAQTLHLDNQDVFRHTFTVPDRDLDVDLPASTAARVTVELPPGRYDVICDIAGHEHMTTVLVVE